MDKDKIIFIKKFLYDLQTRFLKDLNLPISLKTFAEPRNKHNFKHICKLIDIIPELGYKGNLLDIGLGSGKQLFSIVQAKNYNFYSIEHPKMNELLKYNYFRNLIARFNIHLKRVDIVKSNLPYKDNFFDVVVFNNIIEHMQPGDVFSVLREIHRILRKDGILIVETPNIFSLVHRIKAVFGIDFGYDLGEAFINKRGYPSHIKEYSINEIKILLKNYGFRTDKLIMSQLQYGKPIIDAIVNIPVFFWPYARNTILVTAKKINML